MIKEILVPVDGSEYDSKAIEFAAEMSKPHEARVHLVHVVRKTPIPKGLEAYIRSEGIDETPQSLTLEVMGKGVIQAAADQAKEMICLVYLNAIKENQILVITSAANTQS